MSDSWDWECSDGVHAQWYWTAGEAILFSTLGVVLVGTYWAGKDKRVQDTSRCYKISRIVQLILVGGLIGLILFRISLHNSYSNASPVNMPSCRLSAMSPVLYWFPVLFRTIFTLKSFSGAYKTVPIITHLIAFGISMFRFTILCVRVAPIDVEDQLGFKLYVLGLTLQALIIALSLFCLPSDSYETIDSGKEYPGCYIPINDLEAEEEEEQHY